MACKWQSKDTILLFKRKSLFEEKKLMTKLLYSKCISNYTRHDLQVLTAQRSHRPPHTQAILFQLVLCTAHCTGHLKACFFCLPLRLTIRSIKQQAPQDHLVNDWRRQKKAKWDTTPLEPTLHLRGVPLRNTKNDLQKDTSKKRATWLYTVHLLRGNNNFHLSIKRRKTGQSRLMGKGNNRSGQSELRNKLKLPYIVIVILQCCQQTRVKQR